RGRPRLSRLHPSHLPPRRRPARLEPHPDFPPTPPPRHPLNSPRSLSQRGPVLPASQRTESRSPPGRRRSTVKESLQTGGNRDSMTPRPRIACVATIVHTHSHAQHFIDRFLEGYGWNGRHHRPEIDLVSLYVDQVKENDLSRDRAARFPGMTIYPTVADALTLGGSGLA